MQDSLYPWLKHYPDNIEWNQSITPAPVFQMLQDAAVDYRANAAMDFLGKKYTWGALHDLSRKLAKGLQNMGVGKGYRIGLFLPNSPYYLISYYAVMQTGATVVNFNPLYAEAELADLIELSETDLIITTNLQLLYGKMEKMLNTTRLKKLVMCPFPEVLPFPKNILFPILKRKDLAKIGSDARIVWLKDLMNNAGDVQIPEIDPVSDLAVLQFTGGTTGLPKAAMLTHYNIYANAMQAKAWFHQVRAGQDKMLGVLPFFHVFAMTAVMNFSVALGLEIIALPRFDLEDTLATIHKKKPNLFPAVPAIYNAINNSAMRSKYDLSSLKFCLSGGAPLPVEVKKSFEEKTGCVVIEGYGLSEASPVATANPIEGDNRPASIGLPFPQTIVEIISQQDGVTPVPFGERGELCVRGPQVMRGYWKNPKATGETLRRMENGDMRLHTGDIATMDKDGFVYIVDRIKDMIITNGYKVYPRNVEEVIYKFPGVEECIVAGIPDSSRGEIVKCWIKLKDGWSLDEEELKEFLKDKISPMEIPKLVEFRTSPLPKTMIGKLSRKDVLAQEQKV